MSWFNYPPDVEPVKPMYFREHKLTAERIDPGIALATKGAINERAQNKIAEASEGGEIRPYSIGFRNMPRLGNHYGVCQFNIKGDYPGSPDDSIASWLRSHD